MHILQTYTYLHIHMCIYPTHVYHESHGLEAASSQCRQPPWSLCVNHTSLDSWHVVASMTLTFHICLRPASQFISPIIFDLCSRWRHTWLSCSDSCLRPSPRVMSSISNRLSMYVCICILAHIYTPSHTPASPCSRQVMQYIVYRDTLSHSRIYYAHCIGLYMPHTLYVSLSIYSISNLVYTYTYTYLDHITYPYGIYLPICIHIYIYFIHTCVWIILSPYFSLATTISYTQVYPDSLYTYIYHGMLYIYI